MSRRVYVYFALTFLLGALVGAGGVFFFAWHSGHWHRGFNQERLVRHLQKELSLTPEQTQQVTQIFNDSAKKFEDVRKQTEPQFQAIRDESRSRIRQILNPDQLKKFDDLVRRWDERHKRRSR